MMSRAALASSDSRRAQMRTFTPSRASARAVSRPIPLLPPVTSAVVPASPSSIALASALAGAAVEELDRHALRRLDEADAHARPHRGRLAGELDALLLQVGGDRVDAAYGKPEMIEAAIGYARRRIDAVAGRDRSDEDIGA